MCMQIERRYEILQGGIKLSMGDKCFRRSVEFNRSIGLENGFRFYDVPGGVGSGLWIYI